MARKLYAIAKLNEISDKLDFDKDKALTLIMNRGKQELERYVQVYWYDKYTKRKNYIPTGDFLRCVKARRKSEDEIEVYYDSSELNPSYGGIDEWNSHMGFDYSPFAGDGLLQMLEFGMNGGSPNNPRFGDNGAQGLKRLRAFFLTYVHKAIAESFK